MVARALGDKTRKGRREEEGRKGGMLQPKLEEKAADRMTRERVRLGRGGTTTAAGCSAVQGRLIWSELGRISAGREQSKWPSPVLSYLMHRAPGSPARTRIECCAMSFI